MSSTMHASTSAERWGPLWGARPDDWAVSEEQQTPGYEAALDTSPSTGAPRARRRLRRGVFLAWSPDGGAEPYRARRVGGADRPRPRATCPRRTSAVGDMESLPYEDDTFDLVTGFTSFFFANDMVAALREAGSVASPGASVVIQVWGAHERCSLEAMKEVARPFMPPRPPDAPPDPDFRNPACSRRSRRRRGSLRSHVRDELGVHVSERRDPGTCAPRSRRLRAARRPRARGRGRDGDRRRVRSVPPCGWQLQARERVPGTSSPAPRSPVPLPRRHEHAHHRQRGQSRARR